jgi:hypothetical protein
MIPSVPNPPPVSSIVALACVCAGANTSAGTTSLVGFNVDDEAFGRLICDSYPAAGICCNA